MKNSTKITLTALLFSVVVLTGCGGGGGGGPSAPNPAPSIPNPGFSALGEYSMNNANPYIDSQAAYDQNFTGAGSTIAVVDTGITDNMEMKGRITTVKSFAAYDYNATNKTFTYVSQGLNQGQIESVILPSADSNATFSSTPTVTITGGGGSGAQAAAVLDSNGSLKAVYMTQNGSGYTTDPTVTISDGNSTVTATGSLTGSDLLGHGTFVANIAAANKNSSVAMAEYGTPSTEGVAYGASIMNIKVYQDGVNTTSTYQATQGIDYAQEHGANVINLSLGTTVESSWGSSSVNILQKAVNAGSTIVVAAGNSGLNCEPVNGSLDGQCSFPAATPWVSGNSGLLNGPGGWIVVGSVDQSGVLSSFSNKAGVTKSNYVVAPGENLAIFSPKTGSYIRGSGTSYAAAVVSGAVALLHQKYPSLTGKKIEDILFSTATDLGAPGVDPVYGNGEINLKKAFAPIGTLSVATNGENVAQSRNNALSVQRLRQTKLVGNSTLHMESINFKSIDDTVAFDSYGRGFHLNLSQAVGSTNNQAINFNTMTVMGADHFLVGFNQATKRMALGFVEKGYRVLFSMDNTLFGVQSGGLFATSNNNTYYYQIKKDFAIKNGFGLQASISGGVGTSSGAPGSLVDKVSNAYALGGRLALTYKGIGIGYSRPMSVIKGKMYMNIPVGRNINGSVNYRNITESLVNPTPQHQFEIFYNKRFGGKSLYMSLADIKNYDGIANLNNTVFQTNFVYWF